MKKFFLIAFLIIAVICVAGLTFFYGYAGKRLGDKIASACESAFGSAPLFAETPSVSLFPLEAKIGKFLWSLNSPLFSADIEASSIKVSLEWSSLFSGEARFKEILIDSPTLKIWEKDAKAAKTEQAEKTKSSKLTPIFIDRLVAQNGSCIIFVGNQEYKLNDIKIVALNIDPRKGGDLKVTFHRYIITFEQGN